MTARSTPEASAVTRTVVAVNLVDGDHAQRGPTALASRSSGPA
jgi:hypothetical protein